ncbi:bacterial regulatory s, gntR family protein, partial [Vibrio parahaemolyticus VPTS-2010]
TSRSTNKSVSLFSIILVTKFELSAKRRGCTLR